MIKNTLSFFVLSAMFAVNVQAAYPLVCRGAWLKTQGASTLEIYPANTTEVIVKINFKKSAAKYSSATLKPGECTWFDRAIRSTEPANVTQKVRINSYPKLSIASYAQSGLVTGRPEGYFPVNNTTTSLSPVNIVYMPTSSTSMSGIMNQDNYYTFNVNNLNGSFVVESLRCSGVCQ